MKKILVLFNGIHIPMHVVRFSLDMAKSHNFSLHILYRELELEGEGSYPFPNDMELTEEQISSETVEEENNAVLADNIQFLQDECAIAGVVCEVSQNVSSWDILNYTTTAECLFADSKIEGTGLDLPDLLTAVNCPVCLVAETAPKIEHLVFAYDGGEGSRYAVEKFAALFPSMPAKGVHVVSVNKGKGEADQSFVRQHLQAYPALETHHLEGNERTELVDFLRQYPDNGLVVMGAFGRSAFSRIFHKSLGSAVLNETRLSVFIAHK